jgi:sulfopyruvate decarboxylase TPP-binding subunit
MVKDTGFWKVLCGQHNFRFFAGVPFKEVNSLFWGMDAKIMHYIPAANEHIAFNMAAGARISGIKSGVILSPDHINNIDFGISDMFKIPVIIITKGFKAKGVYTNDDLLKVIEYIETKGKTGVFLYEEIYGS